MPVNTFLHGWRWVKIWRNSAIFRPNLINAGNELIQILLENFRRDKETGCQRTGVDRIHKISGGLTGNTWKIVSSLLVHAVRTKADTINDALLQDALRAARNPKLHEIFWFDGAFQRLANLQSPKSSR